ncbi:raffinose/stachyose/melibiose transport system permease protein [Bacillus mesophilus]|uniref:Sugar ABC transporter permease n=1 Tax=Bacillus mesophilus TaxID=1808955 RepID=A0A6M0QCG9_9BACI|nr:sugar ABC transporter permease [Bacillus mesophilus]MBM7662718.1 raffinose/stachyose/melibiose transport system permease protein [Bacillus mesophilus]NEY73220.1 sugar ABC transporter permease [Bacillus mesophilus]
MTHRKKNLANWGTSFLFLGPTTLFFAITVAIPFIYGIYLTLNRMDTPVDPMVFSGLENYINAFKDTKFWESMWLTMKFVVATVVFVNLVGFGLAYLVTSGLRIQNSLRTAYFTPNLIGGLVLGYIWQFIFVQSLPAFGQRFGIEFLELGWLGDPTMAFWSMVIVMVWQTSGYMMIIFIAGLISIPKELIEASKIDGASAFKRLMNVTIPLMVPSFVVTVFLSLKNAFMVYDLNYSLTKGGPFGSTEMVSMHVVNKAFVEANYGMGQAQGIILFVIVAVITGIQVYSSKKMEVEA